MLHEFQYIVYYEAHAHLKVRLVVFVPLNYEFSIQLKAGVLSYRSITPKNLTIHTISS